MRKSATGPDYGPKVKGYLRKQFGDQLDEHERDYVFQKSLIKFWDKITSYETSKGTLRGWWIRIARNEVLDHIEGVENYRAKYNTKELDDPADDNSNSCDDVELVLESKEKKRLERVCDFTTNWWETNGLWP